MRRARPGRQTEAARILAVFGFLEAGDGLSAVAGGVLTGRNRVTLPSERCEKGVACASSRKYFCATLSSISCLFPFGSVTTQTTFFSFFFKAASSQMASDRQRIRWAAHRTAATQNSDHCIITGVLCQFKFHGDATVI